MHANIECDTPAGKGGANQWGCVTKTFTPGGPLFKMKAANLLKSSTPNKMLCLKTSLLFL